MRLRQFIDNHFKDQGDLNCLRAFVGDSLALQSLCFFFQNYAMAVAVFAFVGVFYSGSLVAGMV